MSIPPGTALKKFIHRGIPLLNGNTVHVCSSHLITHYRYVRVTEKYTETLHVKKMADLVTVR